jgi:hypothetical protein
MNSGYIPAKLVERACTGPLAPYIKSYVTLMEQAGYAPPYVRENLTVLAAFGRRLERCGLGVENLNEDVVDRFVRKRYPEGRLPRHDWRRIDHYSSQLSIDLADPKLSVIDLRLKSSRNRSS